MNTQVNVVDVTKREFNALALVEASIKLKDAQGVAAVARQEFLSELPYATAEQAEACIVSAREVYASVAIAEMAGGLNQKFKLTEEQSDQLAAAKAEHKVVINNPAVKAEAIEQMGKSRLRSFKMRYRKDGRMTVAVTGVL